MGRSCMGCPDRAVWYDDNGIAHSCHEACDRHAADRKDNERIKQVKRRINDEIDTMCRIYERLKKDKKSW